MVNISSDIAYDDLYPYKAGGFTIQRDTIGFNKSKEGPQDLYEVIHCLENARYQGEVLDNPEGACYKSFSHTLIKMMVDVLKTCYPD